MSIAETASSSWHRHRLGNARRLRDRRHSKGCQLRDQFHTDGEMRDNAANDPHKKGRNIAEHELVMSMAPRFCL